VEKLRNLKAGPGGTKLFAVDVNSKFELSAGVKDIGKLSKFIEELNKE